MLAGDATLLLKFLGMKFFLSSIQGIETIFMESFKVLHRVNERQDITTHTKKIKLHDGKNVSFL